MPPVVKVKKEDIVEAGYLIVREEGMEGVNARSIARRLKCSIQPIFFNFETMEELKKAIIEKMGDVYRNYILDGLKETSPYKGMGRGYIKFAKEEPRLFQILFMGNHKLNSNNFLPEDYVSSIVLEQCKKATNLSDEEIKKFHFKVWICTHGIATLIATDTCDFKEGEIDEILKELFYGLLNNAENKK